MRDWLGLCFVIALFATAGWITAVAAGCRSLLDAVLATYVTAWSMLCVVAAALSLAGLLGSTGLALGGALALLTSLGIRSRRRHARGPAVRHALTSAARVLRVPAIAVLAAVLLGAVVYLVVLVVTTAPNDWDGLTYHLSRAALWLQDGRVSYVAAGNDSRLNGNPPVAEIGMALGLALTHGDKAAAVPSLLALGGSGLAVLGLARRLGLPDTEAVFAGLLFVSLPVVLLHGQAILNDLVVASFLLTATYFLLGTTSRDGALGAVALGLALGTKFVAVLSLPVLILVVAVGTPPGRRWATTRWTALGLVLGAPWYLLNLWHARSLDGGLGADQGQIAPRSLLSVVTSARALTVDLLDLSGAEGRNVLAFVVAGAAIAVAGVVIGARHRDRALARATTVAGLAVAAFPLVASLAGRASYRAYTTLFETIGRSDLATAPPSNWEPVVLADTSRSGYGPLGVVAVLLALLAAFAGARRLGLPALARAYALAPVVMIAVLSLTIVWDEWRSRLQMYAIALAVALTGVALRSRALTWLTVGLVVPTVALVLATSNTKPTGLHLLGSEAAIWSRDRTGQLTAVRDYDGTPALLRAVERLIPADATVVAVLPEDAFLAPLLGEGFRRRLELVADDEPIPADARWLVTTRRTAGDLATGGWVVRYADPEDDWRVLTRGPT